MEIRKYLGKVVRIEIDRPLGSRHPKHDLVYKLNYGFVPGTEAPDGEEIDAYLLGVDKPVTEYVGKCIAIIHRRDDNDDKLVIVPEGAKIYANREILEEVQFQEKYFDPTIIR